MSTVSSREGTNVFAPCQSVSRKSSTPDADWENRNLSKCPCLHDQSEDSQDCVKPIKKRKGKRAIKIKWTEDLENNLVDIIGNNEHFKRKLIFTNTKTASNAEYYERIMKEISARG